MFSPAERQDWVRSSDELADMAAFWGRRDKVLLVPPGTDRAWLEDVCEQMRARIDLVEPRTSTGRLVDDTLLDSEAHARLAELLGPRATIEAWGTTRNVLQLRAALGAAGVAIELDAPAAGDLWTVGYLDSKIALHDLASRVPGLRVAPCHTALDFEHLVGLVRARLARRTPFVVKSNVGVGGFGTFLPRPAATHEDRDAAVESLAQAIAAEPVFREGPYLIEDWVDSPPDVLRPTFDGIVTADGRVDVVGVGGMLIDGTTYRGVAVGEVPLPPEVVATATAVGRGIGAAAARLGFRGWYDTDFVLSTSGDLVATEINARRTSPTHAFAALAHWRADEERIRCVLADDHLAVDVGEAPTWESISPVVEAMRANGIRCAATIVRSLAAPTPAVGVMVGAASYEDARAARRELAARAMRRRPRPRRLPALAQ